MMFIKGSPNSHGFVNPRDIEQMWRDQFDWVYREMDYAVFAMTIHPDVSGRPQVLMMHERLIEHFNSHDGVRWATFEEIADDFKARQPPRRSRPGPRTRIEVIPDVYPLRGVCRATLDGPARGGRGLPFRDRRPAGITETGAGTACTGRRSPTKSWASTGCGPRDWNGSKYLLKDGKGRSELAQDLGSLWPAAEKLAGRAPDPLDPALLKKLSG